jgi:hypothetical protein
MDDIGTRTYYQRRFFTVNQRGIMDVFITTAHFSNGKMWLQLSDGRTLGVPLAYFPALKSVGTELLEKFELSPRGIHWDELNINLSLKGFLSPQKLQPV